MLMPAAAPLIFFICHAMLRRRHTFSSPPALFSDCRHAAAMPPPLPGFRHCRQRLFSFSHAEPLSLSLHFDGEHAHATPIRPHHLSHI
jgi:hypothetical protein